MILIDGKTIGETWLRGAQHLLARHDWVDTTVILSISQPMLVTLGDRLVAKTLDSFLQSHGKFGNHTVAETIFPGYEYVHRGLVGVYQDYPEKVYPRLERHPHTRWGTYAYRLLRRAGKDGQLFNPLEACIEKMKDKKPKRAAYELGLGFGFDLATYEDGTDFKRRMGGPCLSHLSFKLIESRVDLTAMYRSQYYVQRAYGNLLGLARLQAFVADQVGVGVGALVCHSTMGVLEHGSWGWRKSEVASLIHECATLAHYVTELPVPPAIPIDDAL